jgi:MYXO-CTERM domain-containing protein
MRKLLVVLTLALGLVLVPAAMAHVEPSPEKVPADSDSKVTLSAEGEESVPAVKVTVQMPLGVTDVVAHRTPGWKQSVSGRVVTWSGGKIPEGEEGKFSFTAHFPNTPGKVLVFPSIVTYQDGTNVHWIGAESSDTPAPRVTLTASQQTNPPPPPPATTAATTPTTVEAASSDGGSNSWIWIVIAAAILAGVAAILLVRRRRA